MSRTPANALLLAMGAFVLALTMAASAVAKTQAQSKYGGTLVVGVSAGDADSLDPTVSQGTRRARDPTRAMCQRLYDYDAKMQPVPVLAAALPVLSKDKLSYTVQLRQGVLFNDGTPFNAQAVVASVERYMTYPRLDRVPATTRRSTASPRPGRTRSSST